MFQFQCISRFGFTTLKSHPLLSSIIQIRQALPSTMPTLTAVTSSHGKLMDSLFARNVNASCRASAALSSGGSRPPNLGSSQSNRTFPSLLISTTLGTTIGANLRFRPLLILSARPSACWTWAAYYIQAVTQP